jgi:hypothetical protein
MKIVRGASAPIAWNLSAFGEFFVGIHVLRLAAADGRFTGGSGHEHQANPASTSRFCRSQQ